MKKIFGGLANLFFLVKPYWRHGKLYFLGRIALPVLIAPALALIQVRLVQSIIDAITEGATRAYTVALAGVLVGAMLVLTVLRWTFLLLYDRWKAEEIKNKINRGIYEQAIATDYKYFDNPDFYNSFTFAVGELAAKSESAMQLVTEIFGAISVIVAMTAYLSSLGPWVILISVAGQAVCMVSQKLIHKLGIEKTMAALPFERKLNYIHRVAYQKQYAADMKSTALPQKLLSLFDRSGAGKVDVFKKHAKPNTWANMLQFVAWHLCQFAQLAYLIAYVFAHSVGVGMLAGMFTAAGRLNDHLNQLAGILSRTMEVSLYAEKIRAFFGYESEIESQVSGIEPPSGAFSLALRDVSFVYPNASFGLHGVSIAIAPGDKIAIVGENGAGKTTLAKLLLRLYDADSGEIRINGAGLREYDIHRLRRNIGVAFQEPQLYALTVRDNAEIYNVADDAVLRDVLAKVGLDIALDSEVTREFDDSGVMLSGGQSQKLGLARLLHGEFGLLLLDEPSSALDPIAEYELTRLIFKQSRTTTIMVAHRLSSVRDADRIYLMDGGRISEQGSHDELMGLGGKYAEMFAKQAENYVR